MTRRPAGARRGGAGQEDQRPSLGLDQGSSSLGSTETEGWPKCGGSIGCVRTGEPCGAPLGHGRAVGGGAVTNAERRPPWSLRARPSSLVASPSLLNAGLGAGPCGRGPTCWLTGPRRTCGTRRRCGPEGALSAPGSFLSGGRSASLCPAPQIAGRAQEGCPGAPRARARLKAGSSRMGAGPVGDDRRDGADQSRAPATTQGDLAHGY